MSPVGLALGWVGYTLMYFGYCSLRGPGVGLFDLIIPGRDVQIPAGGSGGVNIGTPGQTIPGTSAGGPAALNTGPTGSHWVTTPFGQSLEPNPAPPYATTPSGEGVVA